MPNDTDAKHRKNTEGLAVSVFRHYGKTLQSYLLRRLHGAHQVRDLEQEVYLRLLRVGDAELVRDPQAYMYRIASHVVHEFKQRAKQEVVAFDSEAVDEWNEQNEQAATPPAVQDPLGDEVARERQMDSALAKLPAKSRAMIVLHARDGLSYVEIARELDISVHTVKKHMLKAFLVLKTDIRAVDRQ